LLSRLHVDTSTPVAGAYMLVFGLGLGLVLQVLVLAAQNAVDYTYLGVASSGSILFRQIGGSIGVSIFGAIFANRLASKLAAAIPPGARVPAAPNPTALERLPPTLHHAYAVAIAEALRPVFLTAAGTAVLGFLLTWLLREVPLKATSRAPDPGDGFHVARDADGLRELGRALSQLAGREQRWVLYERLAGRAGLELPPPQLWLLARLGERPPLTDPQLAEQLHATGNRISDTLDQLRLRSLVRTEGDGTATLTAAGRADYERFVATGSARLRELLAGWQPPSTTSSNS